MKYIRRELPEVTLVKRTLNEDDVEIVIYLNEYNGRGVMTAKLFDEMYIELGE